MTPLTALRRFFVVSRAYGLGVAWRVTRSKILGKLDPANALPPPPVYVSRRRMSVIARVAEHDPETIEAVARIAAAASGALEAVFCEGWGSRAPAVDSPAARLRGSSPFIRVVDASDAADAAQAAGWTIEQATGRFIAVLAPGFTPTDQDVERLLATLEQGGAPVAAGLFASGAEGPPRGRVLALALRKSFYLDELFSDFPMTAPALHEALERNGTPVVDIPCGP